MALKDNTTQNPEHAKQNLVFCRRKGLFKVGEMFGQHPGAQQYYQRKSKQGKAVQHWKQQGSL